MTIDELFVWLAKNKCRVTFTPRLQYGNNVTIQLVTETDEEVFRTERYIDNAGLLSMASGLVEMIVETEKFIQGD